MNKSTFVSKYYEVEKAEIIKLVDDMKTVYRQKDENSPIEVKECRLCDKKNKSAPDNLWKLNIRPDGSYNCYRCEGAKGSWFDLKRKAAEKCGYTSLQDGLNEKISSSGTGTKAKKAVALSEENSKKFSLPSQTETSKHHHSLYPRELTPASEALEANRATVKEYLNTQRGLNDEVLQRYGVGFAVQQYLGDDQLKAEWVNHLCVTFPWMLSQAELDPSTIAPESSAHTTSQLTVDGVECITTRTKYRY